MDTIGIRFGNSELQFGYDRSTFEVLLGGPEPDALSDQEIGRSFDDPIAAPPLDELCSDGGTVLIVVPDATRSSAAGQVVNLVVRRLIAAGVQPFEINAIFATGIHRSVTEQEKQSILTPFIARRVKSLDHRPRDLMGITRLGETSGGIPVELNRAVTAFDHVITVGAINFHYFAGFTGGRKLICPGLGSSRTISGTHRLAFDEEKLTRPEGVGPGRLEGNPVHEAFMEAVTMAPPSFAINTFVDETGRAVQVVCGDWRSSHIEACEIYAARHTLRIPKRRPIVVTSCGGSPYDLNLIQAHKALETASYACEEGGTIVLFAECSDGTGRDDFIDWFGFGDSRAIAENLVRNYKVNGQTAWSLKEKTERFDVRIVTDLPGGVVGKLGMRKTAFEDVQDILRSREGGFLLPFGARFLPVVA